MPDTPPPTAPNASATEDSLGYDAYAKTLWTRIEQALNRDAVTGKLGDDPLVVGIFGEWGAGKSFLLGRILKHAFAFEQGRIDRRKGGILGNAGFGLTVPVFFQPWKYEHEEHLHVPLMLHILEALKRDLAASKSITERAKAGFDEGGDWLVQHMKPAVAMFEKLVTATAVVTVTATSGASLVTIPAMSIVKRLLSWLPSKKPDKPNLPATIRYSNEGRYFYEIHQHLKAVTRPASRENHKKGYTQSQQSQHDKLDINFVVFVDDLDRCLPEKAVAVLELIKTVFNVESFAFVLALDDEVIERGISHRYKDYSFGNKKSEMPITGFEYLEKIVHLPFRLPALTYADALRFLQRKEEALVKLKSPNDAAAPKWFSPLPTNVDARRVIDIAEISETEVYRPRQRKIELNLAQLVLAAFDGYVPRKLDRVVELFHQVVSIAAERGRPLGVSLGDDADSRVVLALVLLQLFQPELYRCLKRTGNGFDVLRGSMKDNTLSPVFSDQDLLHWACYGTKPPSERVGETTVDQKLFPPINVAEALRRIAQLDDSERYPAQRIRLPIVERMLEHRAAQRHVFDPLKLFAELNKSFADVPLNATDTRSYYSLLTVERVLDGSEMALQLTRSYSVEAPIAPVEFEVSVSVGENASADPETLPSTPPPSAFATDQKSSATLTDVRSVYLALISAEASDQADLVNRAGLRAGQVIASSSAADLFGLVDSWINNQSATLGNPTVAKQRLLRGLLHLAPHLTKTDAQLFWALVQDAVELPTKPDRLIDEPQFAAHYIDVRSALGQDDRFHPKRPYIMKKRYLGHDTDVEPVPGFVRVPKGDFTIGHSSEEGNRPRVVVVNTQFYIARMLTTVEQFALFVGKNGYQPDELLWNRHGVEWLALFGRKTPDRWSEQLVHRSRPVTNVTWFEAQAYARWLSMRLRNFLDKAGLNAYEVSLPNEHQWERAARAKNLTEVHEGRWPWGDDVTAVMYRANVASTGIGGTSSAGLFAPTAIGLHDMAGNVWEWMGNDFRSANYDGVFGIEHAENHTSAFRAHRSLRGGSWADVPETAGCSYRNWNLPIFSNGFTGLRVVLSKTQSASANPES